MLYCAKCKIDYEEGKKFCKQCGSKLEFKPVPQQFGTTSVAYVQYPASNESPQTYCPSCKELYPADKKFCKNCGLALSISGLKATSRPEQKVAGKPEPTRPVERPFAAVAPPTPAMVKPSSSSIILKAAVIVVAVALFAVGGFFGYRYFLGKNKSAQDTTAQVQQSPAQALSQSAPQVDDLKRVFEDIRTANINKDINLFMSYYSPSFAGFEEKKNKTLSNWREYDFTELTFTLRDLEMRGDAADVKVDWKITTREVSTGKTDLINVTNTVSLRNEGGKWKIIDLR